MWYGLAEARCKLPPWAEREVQRHRQLLDLQDYHLHHDYLTEPSSLPCLLRHTAYMNLCLERWEEPTFKLTPLGREGPIHVT